jgi:hypothetical protein
LIKKSCRQWTPKIPVQLVASTSWEFFSLEIAELLLCMHRLALHRLKAWFQHAPRLTNCPKSTRVAYQAGAVTRQPRLAVARRQHPLLEAGLPLQLLREKAKQWVLHLSSCSAKYASRSARRNAHGIDKKCVLQRCSSYRMHKQQDFAPNFTDLKARLPTERGR